MIISNSKMRSKTTAKIINYLERHDDKFYLDGYRKFSEHNPNSDEWYEFVTLVPDDWDLVEFVSMGFRTNSTYSTYLDCYHSISMENHDAKVAIQFFRHSAILKAYLDILDNVSEEFKSVDIDGSSNLFVRISINIAKKVSLNSLCSYSYPDGTTSIVSIEAVVNMYKDIKPLY